LVISFSTRIDETIERHIGAILGQLNARPERFGIGEADPNLPEREWYPPNAFHTYWTMEIIDLLKNKFADDYRRLSRRNSLDLKSKREGLLLWARHQLGYQIALHSASPPSSMLDSDQLAWSLAIFLRFDENFHSNLDIQDFVRQAFKCLFSTQIIDVGTWRHYKPLFHYQEAGNAYCYVFETFAVLLRSALRSIPEAEIVRGLLRPYCQNLMDLWRYADSMQIQIPVNGKAIGWCSGHRTNVTSPESWATASVFSYTQALRRLIGIWCRDEASNSLNTLRSRLSPEAASKEIASRGKKTWGSNRISVSEQLWTTFINPIRMHECTDGLEPDSQPIENNHARSAILFGPPGTSKTTLIRSLADVIGWKYVEIHASHFVKEGLGEVQKTADDIFKRLSELDHTVVLFDEIDELVRERDMEKDAFGRFLTTSMLPKLAELWGARKILYFVATNHINYFDSAIIRSHRFDALILVSPSSFGAKIERLQELLNAQGLANRRFETKEREIQQQLDILSKLSEQHREEPVAEESVLAKFALLRWDEIDELALRIAELLKAKSPIPKQISSRLLREALSQVKDSEWRKNKSYLDYLRDTRSERRDYQMLNVWEARGKPKEPVPGLILANHLRWLAKVVSSPRNINIPGFDLRFTAGGRVVTMASRSE
jgi:hypothetical protein